VFHNYIELQHHASCMGLTRWWMDSFMRGSLVIVIGCKSHSIWSALLCKEISCCLHGLYGCLKAFCGMLGISFAQMLKKKPLVVSEPWEN